MKGSQSWPGRERPSLRPTAVHASARAPIHIRIHSHDAILSLLPPLSPLPPSTGNTRAPIGRSWLTSRLSIGREPAVCVPAFRHGNLGVRLVHFPQRSEPPCMRGLRLSKSARDGWTRRLCRRSPAQQQHFSRGTLHGAGTAEPSHECRRSGGSRRHVVGRGQRR